MFEHFTEGAIKAVMLAQEEARRLGHNQVGTEQILLGVIGEGSPLTKNVFKTEGITLKEARHAFEDIMGRGSGFVAVEIPFTERAKRTFEHSWDQARLLGDNYIGVEHLLLGVIATPECNALKLLKTLAANPERMRKRIFELRNVNTADPGLQGALRLMRAREYLAPLFNSMKAAKVGIDAAKVQIKECAQEFGTDSGAVDPQIAEAASDLREELETLHRALTEGAPELLKAIKDLQSQLDRLAPQQTPD